MNFSEWIDALIQEKGYDPEELLEVEGASGWNLIPLGCLIDAMKAAPAAEQTDIQAMLVWIDFVNGDCLSYLRHLARAIAL